MGTWLYAGAVSPGTRSAAATALASAVAAAACSYFSLSATEVVASVTLAALMGAIAMCDLQNLRVPDALAALTGVAGLAFTILWADPATGLPMTIAAVLIQMIVCGGALLLMREIFYRTQGKDGLGLGDVKLAAAAGAWIAWDMFAMATLLASSAALAFVAIRAVADGGWQPDRRIPLAAFLAPAIWLIWIGARM